MRYPTVLFDLDHTLFDSDTSLAAAYTASMTAVGVADAEQHRADFERINDALWRQVERGELSPNDVRLRRFEQLLTHLGSGADAATLAPEMADAFVGGLIAHGELYDGALALLDALEDRQVALVTNGIGAVQRGRLERLGLADRFDVVAISGELGMAKPDRKIFDHTLALLGDPPRSSVVMIGDNWGSDIVGARAAGVDALWFRPAARRTADDPVADGVTIASTIAEVGRLIG